MPRPPKKKPAQRSPANAILPMQLQVGDRFTDETGEWQIASPTYTTGGGKVVHARVQKVAEPAVSEERSWGAHELVAVRRG